MRTRSKLLIAGFTASLLLSLAVSSSSANNLSSSQRNFRMTWSSLQLEAGFSGARCPVTMEGSFHSTTFTKTAGALIGHVSRSVVGTCSDGRLTIYQEVLPWSVRYVSFSGTLPNITMLTLDLVGTKVRFEYPSIGIACTSQSTVEHPWRLLANLNESGVISSLHGNESFSIPLEGECSVFGSYTVTGTGAVTQLGTTSSVVIRLILGPPPTLTPSPVAFGRIEVEGVARRTVTVTAPFESLTINSIRIRSGNYFAITDPNRCVGTRLTARGTCSFVAVFTAPREAGGSFEDTIVVETSLRRLEASTSAST